MKDAAEKVFDLPLEEKNKVVMPLENVQGDGHAYVVSEEQILDWLYSLMFIVYPSRFRNLKVWTTTPNDSK